MAFSLVACQHNSKNFKSYEEYPMKKGSLDEMVWSPKATSFSLWAPAAEEVVLSLYDEGNGDAAPFKTLNMRHHRDGSWTAKVKGNLEGKFYTFKIKDNGEFLAESPGIMAKAVGVNGWRGAIIDLSKTDPDNWDEDVRPELKSFSDVVLYELQHRDFSIDSLSGIVNRGKFLALTEENTLSAYGESSGIDHLVELGVNHIHIMPSYDFGSIDEEHLEQNKYGWGYDPQNYNVPEGSFCTDPFDPGCRIREFKQMVQSLHKHGIRVVMDVVYNHTFNTDRNPFNLTAPGYFYRFREDGSYSNGSGCGNETASDREMMRSFMIESLCYWINEYHVDGFRFDLMGIHDIETMNAIRAAVDAIDPSIYIYGEGWAAGTCELPSEAQALKANIPSMPRIAAFGDELRDAVRGPFNDNSKGAFLVGVPGNEESIKFGLVGAINHPQIDFSLVNYSDEPWAIQPWQHISYISCHDDMCLGDRLKINMSGEDINTILKAAALGQSIALLSQGTPFIYAGEEVLRHKKFVHNSFDSPDDVNMIRWSNKTTYHDFFVYLRELIALRKAHPAFHMGDADLIRANMEFLPVDQSGLIAFRLNGTAVGDDWSDIIVAFNSSREPAKLQIPDGVYTVVCSDTKVNPEGMGTVRGSRTSVPALSALVMHNQ